jgi:hypothetical protein
VGGGKRRGGSGSGRGQRGDAEVVIALLIAPHRDVSGAAPNLAILLRAKPGFLARSRDHYCRY